MTEPESGGANTLGTSLSSFYNGCVREFYTNPAGCLVAIGLLGSVVAFSIVIVTLIQQILNPMSELKSPKKHA